MSRAAALRASKAPTRKAAFKSASRALFGHLPLKIAYRLLERLCGSRRRRYVVFFLPYEENCDNVLALFRYLRASTDKCLEPIVFSFRKRYVSSLESVYGRGRVLYSGSWEAFLVYLRAHTVVMNRGAISSSIYPYYVDRRFKTFLNLGYGVPVKRVGRLSVENFERVFRFERINYDAWIASSEIEKFTLLACYGFGMEQVRITGMPRNDLLAKGEVDGEKSGRRTVLYAPTWRGGTSAKIFPFPDLDLQRLLAWLERYDVEIVVRPHIVDGSVTSSIGFDNDRLRMDDRSNARNSLAQCMRRSCALVTDYSSIYIDYLLLDRPVIFTPYDIERYRRERGFLYDYESHTPGPKVTTMAGFLTALEESLNEPGKYGEARKALRNKFHDFQDGMSCERVTRLIASSFDARYGFSLASQT